MNFCGVFCIGDDETEWCH